MNDLVDTAPAGQHLSRLNYSPGQSSPIGVTPTTAQHSLFIIFQIEVTVSIFFVLFYSLQEAVFQYTKKLSANSPQLSALKTELFPPVFCQQDSGAGTGTCFSSQ